MEAVFTRCTVCGKDRPSSGKFLHCLHIACTQCLVSNLEGDGSFQCRSCPVLTKSRWLGDSLAFSLVDFKPSVFNSRADEEGEPTAKDSVALCDFCEAPDLAPVTHSCADCIPRPTFCKHHAQAHLKPRVYQGHRLVELTEDEIRSSSFDTSHVCTIHRLQEELFCKQCKLVLCRVCASAAVHASHILVDSHSAATDHRKSLDKLLQGFRDGQAPSTASRERSESTDSTNSDAALTQSEFDRCLSDIAITEQLFSEQRTEAGSEISQLMALIKHAMEEKQRQLMQQIDEMINVKSQKLRTQRQCVQNLNASARVCRSLGLAVESGKFSNVDSIRLGISLKEKVKVIKRSLHNDQLPCESGCVKIVTQQDVKQSLEQMISSIAVPAAFVVDFHKSHIKVPSQLIIDVQCYVEFTLCTGNGSTLTLDDVPHFSAFLISPSGDCKRLTPSRVGSQSHRDGMYKLAVKAHDLGMHCVEMSDGHTTTRCEVTADIFSDTALHSSALDSSNLADERDIARWIHIGLLHQPADTFEHRTAAQSARTAVSSGVERDGHYYDDEDRAQNSLMRHAGFTGSLATANAGSTVTAAATASPLTMASPSQGTTTTVRGPTAIPTAPPAFESIYGGQPHRMASTDSHQHSQSNAAHTANEPSPLEPDDRDIPSTPPPSYFSSEVADSDDKPLFQPSRPRATSTRIGCNVRLFDDDDNDDLDWLRD